MFVARDPQRFLDSIIGNGHCVALVHAAADTPRTAFWRRGRIVRGNSVPHTAIATFDPNGRYGNHTDGRSHAAILLAEEAAGLRVLDQWVQQPAHVRLIRFRGGTGRNWVDDGDRYYVIETEDQQRQQLAQLAAREEAAA